MEYILTTLGMVRLMKLKKQTVNAKILSCNIKSERSNNKNSINVGIQVNSGKRFKNEKIIRPADLEKLVEYFSFHKYKVKILGTEDIYNEKKYKYNGITYLVNKLNFSEWLSELKGLDHLITPEGFPLFFALDHQVKCIGFYDFEYIFDRISPSWRKNGEFFCSRNQKLYYRVKNRIRKKLGLRNSIKIPEIETIFNLVHTKEIYR